MAEVTTEEVEAVETSEAPAEVEGLTPEQEEAKKKEAVAGKSRDAWKGDTVRGTGVPDPGVLDPEDKAAAARLEALQVANANVGFKEMEELRRTTAEAEEKAKKAAEAKAKGPVTAPPGADPSLRPPTTVTPAPTPAPVA